MRTARLEFDEYPDEHVIVRLSGIPLSEFFTVRDAFAELTWDADAMAAFAELFSPFLVSWSFDVPIEEGVFAYHLGLGVAIVREWLKAVRDVPSPLPQRSSVGAASEDPTSSNPES